MKPKSLKKYKKALLWIFGSVGLISVLLSGIIYTSVKISNSLYQDKLISGQNQPLAPVNRLIGFQTLAKFRIEDLDFELQKKIYSSTVESAELVNRSAVLVDDSVLENHDGELTSVQSDPQVPAPVKILAKEQTGHTSDFVSGYSDDNKYYQSPYYYNDRVYMPILDSPTIYLKNERTSSDIGLNNYQGWIAVGHARVNSRVSVFNYRATDELLAKFNNLPDRLIFTMSIDLYQANPAMINETLKEYSPDFVILSNADSQTMKQLVFPSSVKKLTIKSNILDRFDFSLVNSEIQELELYTPNLTEYNPLALNPKTHLIFDADYSTRFLSINLYGAQLTNQQALAALEDVFVHRYYERALQGSFVGGYISSLVLSDTGITSLNNLVIKNINPNYDSYTMSVKYHSNDSGQIELLKTTAWKTPTPDQAAAPGDGRVNVEDKDLRLLVSSEVPFNAEVLINVVSKYLYNNTRVNILDISKSLLKSGSLVDVANSLKAKIPYLNVVI
ncbi:IgG-blocking protein M [Mycoplasmoides gallisepticum]|uniref:IgG-blocking protein M n=1 Tax=Mycoplasmoides gallisepticum TaxID=2096 RepID=UPI001EF5CF7E|nr:IgG-blocking protein M [Mycoplasmoides gallisepticum]ULH68572.1 IgG-blocking protein M [Mycoplasmoides gallisepticum]